MEKDSLTSHPEAESDNDGQKKFTDWKNEPKLKDLVSDYKDSKPDNEKRFKDVEGWLETLKGGSPVPAPKQNSNRNSKPRSRVQPKLVRKNNEWRYAALSEPFNNSPELFRLLPITFDDKQAAVQNELMLNYQIRTFMGLSALVDRTVREFVDTGTVIIKASWIYLDKEETVDEPLYQYMAPQSPEEMQQVTEQYNQISQMAQMEPDSYSKLDEELKAGFEYSYENGMVMIARATGQSTKVTKTKVIKNHPYAEVCNYDDVFVDPTCRSNIQDAKFVVHRFSASFADLKKDPRYKFAGDLDENEINAALEQSDAEFKQSSGSNFNFSDTPRKKLTVLEYWGYWDIDGDGSLVPIVAAWVNNTLIRLEENPYPDQKHPFVSAAYLPARDSIFGIPDAELIGDNQAVIGAVTRGSLDLLGRSANAQTGFKRGWLDAANKVKYMQGDDYDYIPEVGSPQEAVYQHQYAAIPASVQWMIQSQALDAESVTGVKSFGVGGITGEGLGDTAAGARIATDAASQRTTSILRRLAACYVDLGRKMISMNAQFLTEEEVERVTNMPFQPIRMDDMEGNYDLQVSVATSDDDAARAADIAFVFQTSASTLPFELSKLMLAEYAKLKRMPDFAKKIEDYQPEPDPLAQAEREAEIEYKKAQTALLMAQAQEASTKAGLNQFKAGETEAKTAKHAADAEAKSLDNVQSINGEKHQRELDKIRQQTDSNQITTATKAAADLQKADAKNQSSERVALLNAAAQARAAQNKPAAQ